MHKDLRFIPISTCSGSVSQAVKLSCRFPSSLSLCLSLSLSPSLPLFFPSKFLYFCLKISLERSPGLFNLNPVQFSMYFCTALEENTTAYPTLFPVVDSGHTVASSWVPSFLPFASRFCLFLSDPALPPLHFNDPIIPHL